MSSPILPSAASRGGVHQSRDQVEIHQLAFLQSEAVHPLIAEAFLGKGVPPPQVTMEAVQHRPGAGATGIYRVSSQEEMYVGVTTEHVTDRAEGVLRSQSERGQLVLWQHPMDPLLPGLQLATDPGSVTATWGAGSQLTALQTVSYRPLRRAVISADFSDGRRIYLKVLREGHAPELAARHRMLVEADVPAPVPVGDPICDVLALEQGRGISLAEHFMADGAAAVRPADFVQLLDALPVGVMGLPARDAWTDRLPAYASAAISALPQCERRIRRLEEEVLEGVGVTDRGPMVPTHGDYYEANLLMQGPSISALLDVDSLGPGYRVDDLACFLGHLAVLPAVDARYIHAPAAFDRFARVFAAGVDPESLRIRTAAVGLSLVAGARDVRGGGWQEQADHRLRCAEVLLGLTPSAGDLPHWPAVL
ncbi:phosphotransferase [Nesterenkonia sphaerica]|uniref:Aminoglycoside phosphotransferase family protein n=1 Tax=Nesterenkonia sphaerica TaxID=1804988 RepID=A0A5R9AFK7_9MICC|nr:phosphotransferase [Nesterenkonia sphaerica]TLP76805.1 aminoglycoside phosphotransferase family protein [Nesterenkonia sphaerica]